MTIITSALIVVVRLVATKAFHGALSDASIRDVVGAALKDSAIRSNATSFITPKRTQSVSADPIGA